MLSLENVCKSYRGRKVLSDVSFTVPDGKITGFIGPNGSGKTTSMRVMTGLEFADSGSTLVNGEPFDCKAFPGQELGAFFGGPSLPENEKGRNLLIYTLRMAGEPVSRADKLLEWAGIGHVGRRPVKHYSLGMRQRLGIAIAFSCNPRNIVLDEPTNGLDPFGREWLYRLLRERADAGAAVLVSSHVLSELDEIADRIVIIDGGSIVLEDELGDAQARRPLEELFRDMALFEQLSARSAAPSYADVVGGVVAPDGYGEEEVAR